MREGYLFLAIAILGEVAATTALKASAELTKPLPTLVVVIGYAIALYFLAVTLRSIPIGAAYSIWAGVGTALIALLAYVVHDQSLDQRAVLGMALIVFGVALVNSSGSTVKPKLEPIIGF